MIFMYHLNMLETISRVFKDKKKAKNGNFSEDSDDDDARGNGTANGAPEGYYLDDGRFVRTAAPPNLKAPKPLTKNLHFINPLDIKFSQLVVYPVFGSGKVHGSKNLKQNIRYNSAGLNE